MAIKIGTGDINKLYLGSSEISKAYQGSNEVYNTSSGGAWLPSDITASSLQLWYDANDSSTIAHTSGRVSQWDDKSGNSRHLVEASASRQPYYTTSDTDGNNLDTIHNKLGTSGVGMRLTSSFNYRYVFVVLKYKDGIDSTFDITSYFMDPSSFTGHFVAVSGASSLISVGATTYEKNASNTKTDAQMPMDLCIMEHDIGTDLAITSIDFFNENPGSNLQWQGMFPEIILCDNNLTAGDREKIEGYLAHKWGLDGDLPSGHPYKSSAP